MLPRVKIYYENGALGSVAPSEDGVIGIVASGTAVADKFALGTAYLITKLSDLDALGITEGSADVNKHIYKCVKEIYSIAQEGSKVWLQACANTVTMTDMFDKTKTYAKTLLDATNGAINILVSCKQEPTEYTPTIVDGLDGDVYTAMAKAQELAVWSAEEKYAPLFVILEGRRYAGTASSLRDLHLGANNRVQILVADTEASSNTACVGLLAGTYANVPVHRSAARVKNGALPAIIYIGTNKAELGSPDVIHDAGFVTARTFIGKAGYFWTDDKLATAVSDDYALVPRRRVIDKAYRIAYATILEEIGDEMPVTDDGKIPAAIAKSIQNKVETAIENTMTVNGELGVDPGNAKDTGVKCFIDINQNVVSTSKFIASLQVKPYGYTKYIDVYLGFQTTSN
ncbi:MAG TPA: DUF2586 family protein [Bacteroidales bacterium]|jgi:hypothetical protein|nr:DUF2586 family protein [Bacteroidales bacterium]HRS18905.1 DUF2586 family protein [Bacteroidales bacterium]